MRIIAVIALSWLAACGPVPEGKHSELYDSTTSGLYPLSPDLGLTPGKMCANPSEYRYPEHIAYCRRSVSSSTKNAIIRLYDQTFGTSIQKMPRDDFKIDHYIPLCMGGDNDRSNLWPQHKSIYEKTDPLEQNLCILLERAKVTQAHAIEVIQYAKLHSEEALEINQQLELDYDL